MSPGWVTFAVLALAAYRLTRISGWDDFPPVARARAWLVGEKKVTSGDFNRRNRLTSEAPEVAYVYRWPTLSHFLSCPFCSGFWWSVVVYVAWLEEPRVTLYAAVPLALSATVGLVARNLDP